MYDFWLWLMVEDASAWRSFKFCQPCDYWIKKPRLWASVWGSASQSEACPCLSVAAPVRQAGHFTNLAPQWGSPCFSNILKLNWGLHLDIYPLKSTLYCTVHRTTRALSVGWWVSREDLWFTSPCSSMWRGHVRNELCPSQVLLQLSHMCGRWGWRRERALLWEEWV